MLESITWKTYLTVIIITACIYYAFVGLLYFRPKMKSIITGQQPEAEEDFVDVGGIDELEKIMDDIRISILEQAGEEANKGALLQQFSQKLANYGGLRQPAYQLAVNNYLIQHAQMICGIEFTDEELTATWQKLIK